MKQNRLIKKHFIYKLLFILLFFSCEKGENIEPQYALIDEIAVSETTLIPDKTTKSVSTILNFKNINEIEYIIIRKSGGNNYTEKLNRSELSSSYLYEYKIDESDPNFFNLIIIAYYKDGNASNELKLLIDNRWGFFIRSVSQVARVTGKTLPDEDLINPNNTATRWNVGGTDLGIVWEMASGDFGIFFGDTFGSDFRPNPSNPGPNGSSWRSNVLAFSKDRNLEDGLTFSSMATGDRGEAREIIYSSKDTSGDGDWTSIPTAAVSANNIDYVQFFNVKDWMGWITNYSGMYKSIDNGSTWSKCEDIYFSSNSNFGQCGFFKKNGYVYIIGTQTGRESNPRLARTIETEMENQEKYEFWNSNTEQWVQGNEQQATNLFQDKAGELSFIYNNKINKWIIAYFNNERYNISMRISDNITGPWSEPYELVTGNEYPQLYGSFIHPLSTESTDLYFLMSVWLPYNVFLMKVELGNMGSFSN